jgi:hypothetical protein
MAAFHWGDPGLGPPVGAGTALGVPLPLAGLGKEVGTPGTPCERMHSEYASCSRAVGFREENDDP